jgi:hypothetical protein
VILRRKRITPEVQASFDAFRDLLVHLEPAKAALTDVMPTTRMPGRPLPDALAEFEEGLARAGERMSAWRTPELESEWTACEQGLAHALSRARRFREDAPELGGFEGLIWAVEELMAPLDAFATAAERFRELGAR